MDLVVKVDGMINSTESQEEKSIRLQQYKKQIEEMNRLIEENVAAYVKNEYQPWKMYE